MSIKSTFRRRTLNLQDECSKDLQVIKAHTTAKTDTAAIHDAVKFRAKYANVDSSKIDLALWVLNHIDVIDHESSVRTVIVEKPVPTGTPTPVHLAVPRLAM